MQTLVIPKIVFIALKNEIVLKVITYFETIDPIGGSQYQISYLMFW